MSQRVRRVLLSTSPVTYKKMENRMNVVVLRGTLHVEPTERTLASGITVTNWELRTVSDDVVYKVPICWEQASKQVQSFDQSDEVVIVGVVRRRFFTAGGATASRTEVLGKRAEKASRRVAVSKLIDNAADLLAA